MRATTECCDDVVETQWEETSLEDQHIVQRRRFRRCEYSSTMSWTSWTLDSGLRTVCCDHLDSVLPSVSTRSKTASSSVISMASTSMPRRTCRSLTDDYEIHRSRTRLTTCSRWCGISGSPCRRKLSLQRRRRSVLILDPDRLNFELPGSWRLIIRLPLQRTWSHNTGLADSEKHLEVHEYILIY